jgi:LysR family hydrogen peroxide-inducible transcriptional activator
MPTLQQLRYLVALDDQKHFRRAAEVSNVTQPTLSGQLKELELRLGTSLIEKNRNPVILTPAGRDIAARARRILTEMEDIRATARGAGQPLGGTLRLGVVQSLGSYLLPLVVPDLHAREPDLRLYVREGLPDQLFDQLESGALDLLFYPLPVDRRDLVSVPIFDEPLLVVASHSHPFASQTSVDRRHLKGETLLTLEPGHRLFEQVRALATEYQARLSRDYEGTSLDTIRQMVAMKIGISLMPALYVKSEVARETLVISRPVSGASPPARTIGGVWRSGAARTESYQRLTEEVRAILARDVPEIHVLPKQTAAP